MHGVYMGKVGSLPLRSMWLGVPGRAEGHAPHVPVPRTCSWYYARLCRKQRARPKRSAGWNVPSEIWQHKGHMRLPPCLETSTSAHHQRPYLAAGEDEQRAHDVQRGLGLRVTIDEGVQG